MPQVIIIAIDADPDHPEVRDLLTSHLEQKLGWHNWHWFPDLWLATGVPDDVRATDLSAELHRVTGDQANILVFRLPFPPSTSGIVPPDSIEWLTKFWSGEEANERSESSK